jgi:hypothetical protein
VLVTETHSKSMQYRASHLTVWGFSFSRSEFVKEKDVRSDKTLRKYYRLINRKFFNNELPDNTCVRWISPLEQEQFEDMYFAWTSNIENTDQADGRHKYCIVISKEKNPGWTAVLASLAHECCHVATEMKDSHGPAFEAKRQMIADRGIFCKGALLKNITIF